MDEILRKIKEDSEKFVELPEEPKTLHELKGEIVEELADLEYADGKERDQTDLEEEKEKIFGIDKISPFGTANLNVFKNKLETMSRDAMTRLCEKVAARIYSSPEDQKKELLKSFSSWSRNNYSSPSQFKKIEKGQASEAFEGAESVNDLEQKLKSKSLSDLQATAARLGFNPGFDRNKLINLIKQEYQR